ncbi:MAG: bamB [Proteobacteria bacterium]|nr:bamB [Pseudomonadota bacterium]
MLRPLIAAVLASLLLGGCATVSESINKINPWAGKTGPKPTELQSIKGTAEARARWSVNIGKAGNYVFTPAQVDGSVYVAAADGTLARIDEGAITWRIKAAPALSAGVGSDGRLVVVGTAKGDVLAFSASDGKPLWQVKVTSEVLAAPTVGDVGVAVKSGDNRIFLLDAKDGARKWFYQRATPPLSLRSFAGPVFAEQYVFAGFPGGKLMALDAKNGAPIWEGTVALPKGATELDRVADIVSLPVFDGSQLCAVAFQGRVACFDLKQGGQLMWARDFSSTSGLVVDGRYLFTVDAKGAVHALERDNGGSVWKQDKLLHRNVSGPAARRNFVAVGDMVGVIHILRREDGDFAARVNTDGTPVLTPLQVMGSGFLVQTAGGTVAAIEVQ